MQAGAVPNDEAMVLPAWWRYALIAMGTIILCSCSAPVVRTQSQLPFSDAQVADEAAAEETATDELTAEEQTPSVRQPSSQAVPPAAPAPISSIEARSLTASPLTMQWDAVANCPTCKGAGCDACGVSGVMGSDGYLVTDPYGPVVGPRDEYLCDGDDYGAPVGVRADWTIEGLDVEDAVSHYDTVDGRIVVAPSNRVCIYAPRFAAVRRVIAPIVYEQPLFVNAILEEEQPVRATELQPVASSQQRLAVGINLGERPPSLFRQRQQPGGLDNLQATMDAYNSLGVYANLEIIRTGEVSDAEKALVERAELAAVTLTNVEAPQVVFGVKMAQAMDSIRQPGVVYELGEPNSPRLRLLKLASCGNAQPGEEIEFTLRFDNVGDQVIGNVTIVDNLSTRLEYVPQSAISSVDADFSTKPNDTDSLILRWEIKEPVEAGEGGILRFRVKVR